jgi:hypothetical protein
MVICITSSLDSILTSLLKIFGGLRNQLFFKNILQIMESSYQVSDELMSLLKTIQASEESIKMITSKKLTLYDFMQQHEKWSTYKLTDFQKNCLRNLWKHV